jgi:hypothetical protein
VLTTPCPLLYENMCYCDKDCVVVLLDDYGFALG